jgi:type IV pilus assembly protein PilW
MTPIRSKVFVMTQSVCHDIGNRGFTLVELMIALAVGGVVMAAVMTAFLSQHRSYLAQDEVVEMQQNARVAMDMMVRDIRSAGYNPNNIVGGVGIIAAGNGTELLPLRFTRDNGAGALETISYSLFDAYATAAPPGNDGLVDDLARQVTVTATGLTAGRQAVAENISNLEFRYLAGDGSVTAVLNDIRSIQVSLMVQTAVADTSPPGIQNYTTPSGAIWASTPGFRSRYLTTTIKCRNLGL